VRFSSSAWYTSIVNLVRDPPAPAAPATRSMMRTRLAQSAKLDGRILRQRPACCVEIRLQKRQRGRRQGRGQVLLHQLERQRRMQTVQTRDIQHIGGFQPGPFF
jgi:hypothetical protein